MVRLSQRVNLATAEEDFNLEKIMDLEKVHGLLGLVGQQQTGARISAGTLYSIRISAWALTLPPQWVPFCPNNVQLQLRLFQLLRSSSCSATLSTFNRGQNHFSAAMAPKAGPGGTPKAAPSKQRSEFVHPSAKHGRKQYARPCSLFCSFLRGTLLLLREHG